MLLREFLYVDVTRARSFLAQLDEGVVETVVGSTGRKTSWDASVGMWAIKGARTSETDTSTQESKSLQDLLFVIFEDIAESLGLIRDVDPPAIENPTDWETSRVHQTFEEGELIRVFTPVVIVDPTFLAARFSKFLDMSTKLNALNKQNVGNVVEGLRATFDVETNEIIAREFAGVKRDDRRQWERNFRKQRSQEFGRLVKEAESQFDQVEHKGLQELFDFMEVFLSVDSIYVRFFACGIDFPEYAFVGSLLARDDYIQRERETLYSRYGARLEGWTSILQVARVPRNSDAEVARNRDFSDVEFAEDERIKRPQILLSSAHLEEMMEANGIVEGPLWPGISVIPLAIYRTVPRSVDPPALEVETIPAGGPNDLDPSGA